MRTFKPNTKLKLNKVAICVIEEVPELKSKLALILGCNKESIPEKLSWNTEEVIKWAAIQEIAAHSKLSFHKLVEFVSEA